MPDRKLTKTDPRRAQYGQRLQAARQAKGLSQEAAAALLGVDRRYLGDLETGRRVESWPAWMAMVTTLGYDLRTVAPELVALATDGKSDFFPTDLNTPESTQPVETHRPSHTCRK